VSTRLWTVDEARAYLPRLRGLLAIIRQAAQAMAAAQTNGHATAGGAPEPDPGAKDVPEGLDAAGALAELEEQGVILRDPVRGLVDFPARHPSGRMVLLCWLAGEQDVAWWHLPEDGFAGRRPLPLPPEL